MSYKPVDILLYLAIVVRIAPCRTHRAADTESVALICQFSLADHTQWPTEHAFPGEGQRSTSPKSRPINHENSVFCA
jgi:hypothetical protein